MKYNILEVIPFADNDGIALATCDASEYVKKVFNVDCLANFKIFSTQGNKRICFTSGDYAASKSYLTVPQLYEAFENLMENYYIYLHGNSQNSSVDLEDVLNVTENIITESKENKVYMKSPNKGGRPKKVK